MQDAHGELHGRRPLRGVQQRRGQATKAILRVDTKTGPQISDSRRQRLTPHRVQLPSPQIDPYRGQTKDTRLVSAASASILLLPTTPGGASAPELHSPEAVVDLYPNLPGHRSFAAVVPCLRQLPATPSTAIGWICFPVIPHRFDSYASNHCSLCLALVQKWPVLDSPLSS
ncbi:uncharacterized protein [Miscanthus floridulus]|uniref:uncharacterized protein isoform X2 n=1 Tax=Miscanthus floridulus TaxID=154761 RepID=UPI0034586C29